MISRNVLIFGLSIGARFLMNVVDRARLEAVVDREVEGIGLPQRIEREGLPLDHRWITNLPDPSMVKREPFTFNSLRETDAFDFAVRSEEHTSELQSRGH